MAELKTKQTKESALEFLEKIETEQKKKDAITILKLMEKATGAKAKMWGSSIVGFGEVKLKYESGRELDWMICGFSPRKQNLVLYLVTNFLEKEKLLAYLGKHKTGKGCIYINKLSEIDLNTLEQIIKDSVKQTTKSLK